MSKGFVLAETGPLPVRPPLFISSDPKWPLPVSTIIHPFSRVSADIAESVVYAGSTPSTGNVRAMFTLPIVVPTTRPHITLFPVLIETRTSTNERATVAASTDIIPCFESWILGLERWAFRGCGT